MDDPKAITVAQLIRLLHQCPQERKVIVEGCDCTPPAIGISIDGRGVIVRTEDGACDCDPLVLLTPKPHGAGRGIGAEHGPPLRPP